ncbi:MAG: helix-turn-helix domain-containing protein [Propionibacteriaceae bacterium]|nr:helix-turn-helix domain-containing protein [Propionibacteriaceae bacterium]
MTEATLMLGCSRKTIYRLLQEGQISGFKLGRDIRIERSSIEDYKTKQAI